MTDSEKGYEAAIRSEHERLTPEITLTPGQQETLSKAIKASRARCLAEQGLVARTRRQLFTDRLAAACFGALYAGALVLLIFALDGRWSNPIQDCRPVDYVHGAWLNPEGVQVAVSREEDGVLHYVNGCR